MMTSLGVWACQWRELRPINFGGSNTVAGGAAPSDRTVNADNGEAANEIIGDEEQGYGRRGRGKGRDGAGEYEMVALKSDPEPS